MNQIETAAVAEPESTSAPDAKDTQPSMEQTIAETWKEIAGRGSEGKGDDESPGEPRSRVGKSAQRTRQEPGSGADHDSNAAAEDHDDSLSPDDDGRAETTEMRRAPNTWRKTAAGEWANLSPVVQEEILKRENDVRQGIEQYREAATRASQYDKTVAPYLATIKSFNVEPHVAVGELLAADHRLRYSSPQEKAHYFAMLAQSYGVDARQLQLPQAPQLDPQVAALMNEVNTLKSQQTQVEQHRKAQVERSLSSEIASFSQDKEHFQDVAEDMANLVAAGLAHSIGDAYEKACRMSDRVQRAAQAKRLADQKAATARKAREARNAASVNVPARGVIPAKAPLGSMEDTIRAEAKRLGF